MPPGLIAETASPQTEKGVRIGEYRDILDFDVCILAFLDVKVHHNGIRMLLSWASKISRFLTGWLFPFGLWGWEGLSPRNLQRANLGNSPKPVSSTGPTVTSAPLSRRIGH
jgi:hypothetical protein